MGGRGEEEEEVKEEEENGRGGEEISGENKKTRPTVATYQCIKHSGQERTTVSAVYRCRVYASA